MFPGQKNVLAESISKIMLPKDGKELASVTDNLPRNSGLTQCAEKNSKLWLSPEKEC